MLRFHHVGIPTSKSRPGETHLAEAKLFITGADASPYRVEWLRFEPGSPMPKEIQTRPHVAFDVDDLDAALKDKKVLMKPFMPMPGLKVAFIIEDDAVIELMQKTA